MHHKYKKPRQSRRGTTKSYKWNCNKGSPEHWPMAERRSHEAETLGEVPRHRRRKKGAKKPFTVEYLWVNQRWSVFLNREDWSVWGRYRTEEARDEALRTLRAKESRRPRGPYFAFRAGE